MKRCSLRLLIGIASIGCWSPSISSADRGTSRTAAAQSGSIKFIPGPGGAGGCGDEDVSLRAATRYGFANRILSDEKGNLYAADPTENTIDLVKFTGARSTLAGTAGLSGHSDGVGAAARLNGPSGLAADAAGNLYIADSRNHAIRKLVLATGALTTVAGNALQPGSQDGSGAAAQFDAPRGLVVDGAGNLYVSDQAKNTIRKVELSTGVVTTVAGSPGVSGHTDGAGAAARLNGPSGLALDGKGNLYIADSQNHAVRKLRLATGAVTTVTGNALRPGLQDGIGTAAQFGSPDGLVMDKAKNLYITDSQDRSIRILIATTRAVNTWVGPAGLRETLPSSSEIIKEPAKAWAWTNAASRLQRPSKREAAARHRSPQGKLEGAE